MSFDSVQNADLNHVGDTTVTVHNPEGAGGGPFVVTGLGLSSASSTPGAALRMAIFASPGGVGPYQGSPAWQAGPGKTQIYPYSQNPSVSPVLTGDTADVYVRVTQANGAPLTGTVSVYAESVGV